MRLSRSTWPWLLALACAPVSCAPALAPAPKGSPVAGSPVIAALSTLALPGGVVLSPPEPCARGTLFHVSGPGSRRVVDDPAGELGACAWVPSGAGECPTIDVEAAAAFINRRPGQHVYTVRPLDASGKPGGEGCEAGVYAHATHPEEVAAVAGLLAGFYAEAGVGGGFDVFLAEQPATAGLCTEAPRGTTARRFRLRDGAGRVAEGLGTLPVTVDTRKSCDAALVTLAASGGRSVVSGNFAGDAADPAAPCMDLAGRDPSDPGVCSRIHFQAIFTAMREVLQPMGIGVRLDGVPCDDTWMGFLEVSDVRQVAPLSRALGEVLTRWGVSTPVGVRAAGEGCVKLL